MSSLKFKSRNVFNREKLFLQTVFLVIPVASAYLRFSNKPEKGVGGVEGYQAHFI